MNIGGLSESELDQIIKVLENQGVSYEVGTDQHIIDSNNKSIQYNLRHLNSPSISTHILSVEVGDDEFEKMDETAKIKLAELGITNEVPVEFSEIDDIAKPEELHAKIQEGNNRLIGTNYLLEAILFIVGLVGYYLIR